MFPGIVEVPDGWSYARRGSSTSHQQHPQTIPDKVERIATSRPDSQLHHQPPWTAWAEASTYPAWPATSERFEERLEQLLEHKRLKLTVGIHSVISTFSVGHLDGIIAYRSARTG